MYPSATPPPAELSAADNAPAALWDLEPDLLTELREIVAEAASTAAGARVVAAEPQRGPRVLAGAGSARYPWKTIATAVLASGETMVDDGVAGAPVLGGHGVRAALLLHHDPAHVIPGLIPVARAYASCVDAALDTATERLRAMTGAVEALAQALAAHDPATAYHSHVVYRLARDLAGTLHLQPRVRLEMEWAALLHDVGKLSVPAVLLQKTGPLDDAEWAIMRGHPAIGERIIRAIPGLTNVAVAVRHHHERWDGAGYPDRLREGAIPATARLIALVDAYETVSRGRPYRSPLSRGDVMTELRRELGHQFDPAFLSLLPALSAYDGA